MCRGLLEITRVHKEQNLKMCELCDLLVHGAGENAGNEILRFIVQVDPPSAEGMVKQHDTVGDV